MIHFVDNNGTIIKTIESPVYQGSAESNNIILIAPFAANLQFTVAFFLPNGEITPRYAMTQGGTLNGVEYAPTNGAMAIWTFSMPNNITQYFGTVYAQFYAYGTNGQITASSRTSFVVAKGVPEELPDTPDQTIYNQILTALSQINTALNNGSYAARAIYWWINTYTYGMNEITFYPIGTYGAFVRSTVTGNTGNQPYNDDGVLDSAHWQELVNFNKIYAAEQNAIAQAQAAAESAQNAEESASAAAQSAQDAADSANSIGQSEQNAAQSAQAAAESAQAAAESASKAEGVLQNAAIKNEAEVIRAPWDFDTQYGDIEFYYENNDTRYVSTDGVTFDVNYNNGDYIKTTKYDRTNIDYQVSESTTYTLEFPEKSGTLALTSDVAAEASERESADNALQSDIDGIQQQLSETQHFRGYYETTAQVQSISNPHSGDYAWNAQTGTVWNYSTSWSDSGVAIPDQTVPKSSTMPLMDGTATLGSTNTYADGAHRHPTDTTRASVTALNSETASRTAADNNLQSQIDDIKDGTTVVGRAKNVTSQIDGHAISDIFETDGTTVKEATQAQGAEQLTVPMPLGNGTDAVINGYYKIASAEIASSTWGEATAFFLISSPNRANNFKDSCLIQCTFRSQGTAESQVYVALLAGSREFLERLYISYVAVESTLPFNADLYLYTNNQTWQDISIKLLYSTNRLGNTIDIWTVPKTNPTVITSLPSGAVNTQLSSIVNLITEAATAETANSLTAVLLTASSDLNDIVGENYYGKIFNWGANSVPANAPSSAAGNMIVVPHGTNTSVQYVTVDTAESSSTRPTTYQREARSGYTSDWGEIVTSNGSYLALGAGHLQDVQIVSPSSNPAGWYKFAEIRSTNTGTYSIGTSFYVDGVSPDNTENIGERNTDGILNIEARCISDVWSVAVSFVAGYLSSNNFVAVPVTEGVDVYVNLPTLWWAYKITLLSKAVFYEVDYTVELTNTYYGTSAPSGAVYAVNRNVAANTKRHVIRLRNNAAGANYIVFFTFTDNSDTKYTSVSALANALYNLGYNSEDNAYPVSGEFLSNGSAPILGNNVFAIYGTNNGFLHVLVQSDIENVLYEDISIRPSIITDI